MKRNNNTFGSIYYNKQRDNWIYEYYETDSITGEKKRFRKSFKTKEKAEKYVSEYSLQKHSKAYIENKGITLGNLIEFLLQKKYESNLITDRGYARTMDTIKIINKCYLSKKKINEIKEG